MHSRQARHHITLNQDRPADSLGAQPPLTRRKSRPECPHFFMAGTRTLSIPKKRIATVLAMWLGLGVVWVWALWQ